MPDHDDSVEPTFGGDNDWWGLNIPRILAQEVQTQTVRDETRKQHLRERYRHKKSNQYRQWINDIIPNLQDPYLRIRRLTEEGRLPPPEVEHEVICQCACTCNKVSPKSNVVLAYWDRLEEVTILYCDCKPASEQLMSRGFFPCAPIRPSMAFDMSLLDLISANMHYLAPNISGWGLTLEWFWQSRVYSIGSREIVKRRFTNTYQWYNVLKDAAATTIQEEIEAAIQGSKLPSNVLLQDSLTNPRVIGPHLADNPLGHGTSTTMDTASQAATAKAPDHGSGPAEAPPYKCRRKNVEIVEEPEEPAVPHPAPSPKLDRPSVFLQRACPLCFGGKKPTLVTSSAHCIVAIDANFAQKCLKPRATDIPLTHPQSHFLQEGELEKIDNYVESMRIKKPNAHKLRLPEDVLQECQDSFIAANEEEAKASAVVYSDTGLVALVCRHDRPLWVANMTTPGERQYYAFALLQRLFNNLPDDWKVGLLYDIACQIERSMIKHGLLADFYPRLAFAVSVFHAYGHQWPCQLLYHPRKVEGFGLSDGEGCERFWSMLKRLIPSLRVSGRYRRRWMIDRQIHHIKKDNLRTLVSFIQRKRKACMKQINTANKVLQQHTITDTVLREEWRAQVVAQTAPIKRYSKSAADAVVESILDMRAERQEMQVRILDLEKTMQDGLNNDRDDLAMTSEELASVRLSFDALKRRLDSKEKQLGQLNPRKLASLKGSQYLRLRMNASALKKCIRQKLVSQKFERARLEKAYREQVVRDKDHQHTKKLLKRSRQSITSLVSRFNHLVQELDTLRKRGSIPRGGQVPARLDAKELYRLDVDDAIWLDVTDDNEAENGLPRWMSDECVRACIPALLECDRVKEGRERLDAEEIAAKSWLREEIDKTKAAKSQTEGNINMVYQINLRLVELWNVSEQWRGALDPAYSDS
ncbi:hypothetical protein M422DRAFT_181663, partial [Sphaerobolus stellatus SS14]